MVRLIRVDDDNVNDSDREVFETVVKVSSRYGVDPAMSIEAEEFFINLLTDYKGDSRDLDAWLDQEIQRRFIAIGNRPRWLQSPEWPFANGKPMIFVGQIDLSVRRGEVGSDIFHDDTSFYVFVGQKVKPVVVMQQL